MAGLFCHVVAGAKRFRLERIVRLLPSLILAEIASDAERKHGCRSEKHECEEELSGSSIVVEYSPDHCQASCTTECNARNRYGKANLTNLRWLHALLHVCVLQSNA